MLCGTMLFLSCNQQQEQREKAPTRVKTEAVTIAAGTIGRVYVGVVEEKEATAVSFTSMGTVSRILVNEGQTVSRGQLIAELDDTQARNMLAAAEAQSRQAEDALTRYSQLHEQGSMTDAQWVEIESKVEQARSQLAIAQKNLSDCRLLAPVSGIVGRKTVNAGETAMPSQAVVTILDISSVQVKFSVPEAEVASIATNTPTTIRVEAVLRDFQGGRIEKGVKADILTHTYDARVQVDNKERVLLPGMVAEVNIKAQHSNANALPALPITAVQQRANGSLFVWTVDHDSLAHRTAVSLGQAVGNRVEIAEGLSEGTLVVTEGYQKLSEGTKVIY